MRMINTLIIHCADTYARMDIGVPEIDQWHRARGWNGCGYHFVIRRSGQIEKGRPVATVGAHAKNHNAESIGICMVGGKGDDNRPADNFMPEQWAALKALVLEMHEEYPIESIIGHRDVEPSKTCPNFDVAAWLHRELPGLGHP